MYLAIVLCFVSSSVRLCFDLHSSKYTKSDAQSHLHDDKN